MTPPCPQCGSVDTCYSPGSVFRGCYTCGHTWSGSGPGAAIRARLEARIEGMERELKGLRELAAVVRAWVEAPLD